MIHVCMAIHDNNGEYCKYLGVAIISLLEHASSRVCFHILHDNSLSQENMRKLVSLQETASAHSEIIFYEIDTSEFNQLKDMVKNFTVGSLFRLKLADVLPQGLTRVIYLDADILVSMDIRCLWDLSFGRYVIAACKDAAGRRDICTQGLVKREVYFNSGVILFNLEIIRKEWNLFSDCLDFLAQNPTCSFPDQDALNYLFTGKVYFLPDNYNLFTRLLRLSSRHDFQEAIYHFAGDSINLENPMPFDMEFLRYLNKSPWWEEAMYSFFKMKNSQLQQFQFVCKTISNPSVRKIIFGANSVIVQNLMNIFFINPQTDYFVDNDRSIIGKTVYNVRILAPSEIEKERHGEFFVLVCSKAHYGEIKMQLESYGLIENVDFINARWLLGQNQGGFATFKS